MEERGLHGRAMAHQYRHAEDPTTLVSAPFHAGEEVDAGTGRCNRGGFGILHPAVRGHLQRADKTVGKGGGHYQTRNLSREPPHVRHDDADTRCRPLYRLQAARPYGREDHTDIRENHQQEKG